MILKKVRDAISLDGKTIEMILWHSTRELRLATIITNEGFSMGKGSGSMLGTGLYANIEESQARKGNYGDFIVNFKGVFPETKVFIADPIVYKQLYGTDKNFIDEQYKRAGAVKPAGMASAFKASGGASNVQSHYKDIMKTFDVMVYFGNSDKSSIVCWHPGKYIKPIGWTHKSEKHVFEVFGAMSEFDNLVKTQIIKEIDKKKNYSRTARKAKEFPEYEGLFTLSEGKDNWMKLKWNYDKARPYLDSGIKWNDLVAMTNRYPYDYLDCGDCTVVLKGQFKGIKANTIKSVDPDFHTDVLYSKGYNSVIKLAYEQSDALNFVGRTSYGLLNTFYKMSGSTFPNVKELILSPGVVKQIDTPMYIHTGSTEKNEVLHIQGKEINMPSTSDRYKHDNLKLSDVIATVFPNAEIAGVHPDKSVSPDIDQNQIDILSEKFAKVTGAVYDTASIIAPNTGRQKYIILFTISDTNWPTADRVLTKLCNKAGLTRFKDYSITVEKSADEKYYNSHWQVVKTL